MATVPHGVTHEHMQTMHSVLVSLPMDLRFCTRWCAVVSWVHPMTVVFLPKGLSSQARGRRWNGSWTQRMSARMISRRLWSYARWMLVCLSVFMCISDSKPVFAHSSACLCMGIVISVWRGLYCVCFIHAGVSRGSCEGRGEERG